MTYVKFSGQFTGPTERYRTMSAPKKSAHVITNIARWLALLL